MANVSITINGRAFDIACDDGQERRVTELAAYIDQRARRIAQTGGVYNDAHLLVLSALVLADELFETREQLAEASAAVQQPVPASDTEDAGARQVEDQAVADVLEQLARRIEGIAARVQAV